MYSIRVKLDLSEGKKTVFDIRKKKDEIARWRKGERKGERIRAEGGGGWKDVYQLIPAG